jgi:holo-[acyl-carrier protein] synthase
MASPRLRIGIDLVDVGDVRDSLRVHGERYLQRIFTEREIEDCRGRPERLAERFAAKEAALKVLREADEPIPWREIEVDGETLRLSGRAAELAAELQLAVSSSHEGPVAAAVVVAR